MQKYNNSTKIIIGLDHGYGNIKNRTQDIQNRGGML